MSQENSLKVSEATQEKSGFDRFESELKETVFAVIFLLIKEEEESLVYSLMDGVIEAFQLFSFPFLSFTWKGGAEVDVWSFFLNLFQVNYYLSLFNWVVLITVFYVGIFFVALTIADIVYVSYAISKKKFSFLWPIKALRGILGLFVTGMFLPLLELFFLILTCEQDDNGNSINTTAPEIVCWQGLHILYAVSAIIVSSVFIVIAWVIAMTYYEVSSDSENPEAKTSSRVDVFQIANKIMAMIVFSFLTQEQYTWFCIVFLLYWSIGWFYLLMFKQPYLHHAVSMCWCLVAGAFMWSNIMLCLNQALDYSGYDGGLEAFFMSLPLVIITVYTLRNPLEAKLMTQFKDLANGNDCYDHIRYFIYLASSENMNDKVCLEGYINKYKEEEKDNSTLLRYNASIMTQQRKESKKEVEGEQKEPENEKKKSQSRSELHKKLMEHAYHLFKKGIEKFPKCTFLRIQYALFLMEKMQNNSWALKQLMKSEKRRPPLDEQFLIYRLKYCFCFHKSRDRRVIEEKMVGSAENNPGSNLDVVSALAYQNHKRQWEGYMEKAAQQHIKFWTCLTEDINELGKLAEIGSEINSTLVQVEEHWEKMQQYKQSSVKVVRKYAAFLKQILNDIEGSKDLLKTISEGKVIKEEAFEVDKSGEFQELSRFTEDGYAVIAASGDANAGKINMVSMGVCSLFGYTKAELIGADTDMLIPRLFAQKHKEMIMRATDKGDDKSLFKERYVYARHRSGYVFTIDKQVKALPSIVNNWQFVICIRRDKKRQDITSAIMLVSKDLLISDLSFRIPDLPAAA